VKKKCGKCSDLKKTKEFSKLSGGRFGVSAWCKKCVAENSKELYYKDKKKKKESESDSDNEKKPIKKNK
jgi:hypothetical protein